MLIRKYVWLAFSRRLNVTLKINYTKNNNMKKILTIISFIAATAVYGQINLTTTGFTTTDGSFTIDLRTTDGFLSDGSWSRTSPTGQGPNTAANNRNGRFTITNNTADDYTLDSFTVNNVQGTAGTLSSIFVQDVDASAGTEDWVINTNVTYGNSFTGSFVDNTIAAGETRNFALSYTPNAGGVTVSIDSFTLGATVVAVPEPSTYALMLGGIVLGFVVIRRKLK